MVAFLAFLLPVAFLRLAFLLLAFLLLAFHLLLASLDHSLEVAYLGMELREMEVDRRLLVVLMVVDISYYLLIIVYKDHVEVANINFHGFDADFTEVYMLMIYLSLGLR